VVLGLFWMGRDLWERPAGRPSRPPSRTTPGGVGEYSRTKLGACDIFLKNLVPKSKLFGLFGECRPRGRPSGRPSRATSGGVGPKVHRAV